MKSTAAPIVIIGVAIIVSFLAAGGSLTTNAANYGELFRSEEHTSELQSQR